MPIITISSQSEVVMYGALFVLVTVFASGCCGTPECILEQYGYELGGGQDVVSANLPFDANFTTQCVQGVGGDYSHGYPSTYFDVDLDTPNDADIPVYAPIDGTAYVHDAERNRNFGVHVNIDLGDGTYLILAHLDDVFVDDASEVATGQLIGIEGTTGKSTGDHVHVGRHQGDPASDGIYGESLEGLSFSLMDSTGDELELLTGEMACDLSGGGRYVSLLDTPRWRPTGSLVKTPASSTVYLVDAATTSVKPFMNESAFLSRGYDFGDVAIVSEDELACYGLGDGIAGDSWVGAAVDDAGDAWLMVGSWDATDRYRMLLPDPGWQGVLATWGITASTFDDLETDIGGGGFLEHYPAQSGLVIFRDGSLVSPVDDSAVYVMADGAALPIDRWETLLLLGWEDRAIVEVAASEFEKIATVRGNCEIDSYCLTREDVTTCGGPHESGEGVYPAEGGGDTAEQGDTGAIDTASGDTASRDTASGTTLSLVWQTPANVIADRISLSGEFTDANGMSYGWNQNIATESNSDSLAFSLPAQRGDSFRFSVEYDVHGETSWSCLAPFPPGTVVGDAVATYAGDTLVVTTADDPGSDGCGLEVTVPR